MSRTAALSRWRAAASGSRQAHRIRIQSIPELKGKSQLVPTPASSISREFLRMRHGEILHNQRAAAISHPRIVTSSLGPFGTP